MIYIYLIRINEKSSDDVCVIFFIFRSGAAYDRVIGE